MDSMSKQQRTTPSFAGLRVAAFESRRAEEMERMIERYGGTRVGRSVTHVVKRGESLGLCGDVRVGGEVNLATALCVRPACQG
jgi:hypothetical protein